MWLYLMFLLRPSLFNKHISINLYCSYCDFFLLTWWYDESYKLWIRVCGNLFIVSHGNKTKGTRTVHQELYLSELVRCHLKSLIHVILTISLGKFCHDVGKSIYFFVDFATAWKNQYSFSDSWVSYMREKICHGVCLISFWTLGYVT